MIRIFVGEEVENFTFNHKKDGVLASYGLKDILFIDGHHRMLDFPEARRHPSKLDGIINDFIQDIESGRSNYLIVTHSKHVIDIMSDLIRTGELGCDDVSIFILDSKSLHYQNSFFDSEGYLSNWPVGFLSR